MQKLQPPKYKKFNIDQRVKIEKEQRKEMRKQEDIRSGLRRSSQAQRGDFQICKEGDKIMHDFRKFNNPKDREKINKQYYDMQKTFGRN